MRRFLFACGVIAITGITTGDRAAAGPDFPPRDARRSMGNLGPRQPAAGARQARCTGGRYGSLPHPPSRGRLIAVGVAPLSLTCFSP